MNKSKDIVQSAALMLTSQVLGLAVSLVTMVIIARTLGEGNFGVFTSLIASVALIAVIPDFGLSPILVRELVKEPENTGMIVGTGLAMRLLLFLVASVLFNAVMIFLGRTLLEISLMNVMMVNILISSKLTVVRNVLESVFRARLKLAIPLALGVFDGCFLLFLVLVELPSSAPLPAFVVFYTLSNLPGFILLLLAVLWKHKINLKFSRVLAKRLAGESFPIFLYVIFITIYANSDILLLRHFSGDYQTGVYAAAIRLTGPIAFVSNAVTVALYPSLSEFAVTATDQLMAAFRFGMKTLMVAGIVVALFGFFTAKWIVTVLYGSRFQGSGPLLQILLISPFFAFLSFFLTNVNIALNRQSKNTMFALVVCGVNIGLNLYLIPAMLASGAAIAHLATEIVGCLLLVLVMGRTMAGETISIFLRSLAFATILFLFLFAIRSLNPILFLCVGTVASLAVLAFVRIFSRDEIEKLKAALSIGSP